MWSIPYILAAQVKNITRGDRTGSLKEKGVPWVKTWSCAGDKELGRAGIRECISQTRGVWISLMQVYCLSANMCVHNIGSEFG